ncbi:hypothetical protein N7462_005292 [Penicillium macrosclerotiorum]|uniref:uncharacterized protein n=1 Tax=Penicillium macrosclerotiorum TaxID=303699 RepID=UPI0025467A07|nr:uncharacterized protein N7462_005292 [Penicillium macrosclerotiorum]KAJ5690900.1 hypothetical protein N7462_005292 [Penicillium macrosclerotiorum]
MSESYRSSPQIPCNEPQLYTIYHTATADMRKKLIQKERYLSVQYQLISIVFNLITITQIIIGATITALGPSGDKHMLAITILGAFNTSIAGLLALLKGRGLPERLRRNMIEISKVSEVIQEREALLRYGPSHDSNADISPLLQEVFQAYASAQQIIERNQTDRYADEEVAQTSSVTAELNDPPIGMAGTGNPNGKKRQLDEEMGTVSAVEDVDSGTHLS